MHYQCSFCDLTAETREDPIFSDCNQNHHEILQMVNHNDPEKKPKSVKKAISKVKGHVNDEFYVESILVDGKPKFLARRLDSSDILIKDTIEAEAGQFRPVEPNECGYFPYSFSSAEILDLTNESISKQALLEEIKSQIDRYVVAKDLDKHLILGNILVTYSQEWVNTLHFPFFVGETESGKSSVLHLGKWLNYRCLYGEDIPNADIYNFLGSEEEGTGTIAEDEAQELQRDREKIRTYKNSYSKGSFKARILLLQHKKQQVFYKTFCPKWFAGEKVPQDKGFLERLAIVYMIEGEPKSNIKRVDEHEVEQLNQLRNKLLVWKLQNLGKESVRVESGLKGRDQELWEDFLSVVHGTKFYDKCKNVVTYYTKQRHQAIHNSLEAKLLKLLIDKMDSDFDLNFIEFWEYITNDNPELPGNLDTKSRRTFYPDDYTNILTHNSLAKILEYKFQGVKHSKRTRDESGIQHQTTLYVFSKTVLEKLVSKYGIELKMDSPFYGGSRRSRSEQNALCGNHVDDVDDLTGKQNDLGRSCS